MRNIEFKQTYPEGCLSSCIFYILNIKKHEEVEKEVFLNSFNNEVAFLDYSLFVINFLSKKLNFTARIIIHTKYDDVVNQLVKKAEKRISVSKGKILPLSKFAGKEPFIINIDNKFLKNSQNHYPHYIVVKKLLSSKSEIFDPLRGETRIFKTKKLEEGIISLLNRLWSAGKLIKIEK